MKDQILKIAKVKSEKEFYKKYPTEAAFMKAHGKAFQKAAMGKTMVAKQLKQLTDFGNPPQAQIGAYIGGETYSNPYFVYGDFADEASANVTGVSTPIKVQNVQPTMAGAQQNPYNFDPGTTGMKGLDWEKIGGDVLPQLMEMKKGGRIPKLQVGPGIGSNLWGPNQPLMGSGYPTNPNAGMYPIQQGNNPVNPPIQQGFEYDPNGQMGAGPSLGSKLGSGVLNNAGNILQGINMLKDEKKQKLAAKQSAAVTGVVGKAAGTRGEISKRRYYEPKDMRFDQGQMNDPKGRGTNYLAEDGAMIGGNPTEIQNTYAPNTIYTNLEYEPLLNNNIKQYKKGGKLTKAQVGAGMAGQLGGGLGSLVGGGKFNQAGGAGKIGSTLGGIAGSFIPGVGTVIGSAVGGLIGGAIGGKSANSTAKLQEEAQNNIMGSALQQGAQSIQSNYSGFMENGGWVSNDWMPQTITQFGEYKMEDLLKPPHDADMLRAGGHIAQVGYTAPSERAMSTERPNFQMGGELQTHWGGYTEAVAENPYLPDGGITYMPRGNYHSQSDGKGNTGIGITFGDNPVEVERGEPMVKLQDGGTGENNLVVLGALDIPDYALTDISKDAKGKKFKSYGTELTKNTTKQNKMVEKATEKINDLEVLTPFDNLEMNSLQAQILGGNMKLKDIAIETEKLGRLQQAIHDSANEFGYSDVAKFNKDVKAKKVQIGNSQPDTQSAQQGGKFKNKGNEKYPLAYNPLGEAGNPLFTSGRYEKEWKPKVEKAFADPIAAKEIIKSIENYTGEGAEAAKKELAKLKTFDQKVERAKFLATDSRVGVYHDIMNNIIDKVTLRNFEDTTPTTSTTLTTNKSTPDTVPIVPITGTEEEGYIPKKYKWQDIYNTVLPYVRPSNQLELDSTQLAGEMYALANNQVEPVFAQSYKPMLSTPFDISLQDQLNANQADYNATQRMVGYNPAALAQLNAQKYAANSAVLGQQTRLNQAEKARVYEANRNILNEAQLKNINIYDEQMFRQSKALSNTKAQTQAALNSISDKYSKNQLENRTAGIYENLYNYRYDNRGRAINMNPLVDFEAMVANASPSQIEQYKKTLDTKSKKSDSNSAKNGNIVKAIKNL